MKKSIILIVIFLFGLQTALHAQTLYVNSATGSDDAAGTPGHPLKSLDKAVLAAKEFSGTTHITIKIEPGIYVLTDKLKIESRPGQADTAMFSLEAAVMPDDTVWKQSSMPVIESVSGDNNNNEFGHCTGFDIVRNNVSFKGLKFLGNANPGIWYYYPIERDSVKLKNVVVSQCYFIGEKDSAPIQGALYMDGGDGVHVDHCVFYGCKNAVLLFYSARNFSLTHSVIYGCYEAGVWYGVETEPAATFDFDSNIFSHCKYFWASAGDGDHPLYRFKHSLISGNTNYVGIHHDGRLSPLRGKDTHTESSIRRAGEVILVHTIAEGTTPRNDLQLGPHSAGLDIDAGIFTLRK
jgi:hypothetical protein